MMNNILGKVQSYQINIVMLFMYRVKNAASVRYWSVAYNWTSYVSQVTRNTRQCLTGHPVVYARSFSPTRNIMTITQFIYFSWLSGLDRGMYHSSVRVLHANLDHF